MAAVSQLYDDFKDLVINSKWTSFNSGLSAVSRTTGLVCTPGSSTATVGYAGYDSATTYSLLGSAAIVKISQAVNAATGAQQYMKLSADASNNVQFILENGTLNFQKTVATVTANLNGGVTFNAVTHAWWRLRESGGTTFWDTSSDGVTWLNQASVANPITLTALTVELAAGTYQSVASPGAGIFNNFNVIPTTDAIIRHFTVGDGMSRSEVAN